MDYTEWRIPHNFFKKKKTKNKKKTFNKKMAFSEKITDRTSD